MKHRLTPLVVTMSLLVACSQSEPVATAPAEPAPAAASAPAPADSAPAHAPAEPVPGGAPGAPASADASAPESAPPPAKVAADGFKMPTDLQSELNGLKYSIETEGTGAQPKEGQTVAVNYVGWLTDGTRFDASPKGKPFKFKLGKGQVIDGWDLGIAMMKVGGKRWLVIPPGLGYGEAGAPPDIPPDATLVFHVELVGIE